MCIKHSLHTSHACNSTYGIDLIVNKPHQLAKGLQSEGLPEKCANALVATGFISAISGGVVTEAQLTNLKKGPQQEKISTPEISQSSTAYTDQKNGELNDIDSDIQDPCNSESMPDLIECSSIAYEKADTQLNTLYKKVRNNLDTTSQANLKKEQLQWIRQKEEGCIDNENDADSQAERLNTLGCWTTKTEERIRQLQQMLN
jgi:uncharacterized protein YecT (DUF1311 family)